MVNAMHAHSIFSIVLSYNDWIVHDQGWLAIFCPSTLYRNLFPILLSSLYYAFYSTCLAQYPEVYPLLCVLLCSLPCSPPCSLPSSLPCIRLCIILCTLPCILLCILLCILITILFNIFVYVSYSVFDWPSRTEFWSWPFTLHWITLYILFQLRTWLYLWVSNFRVHRINLNMIGNFLKDSCQTNEQIMFRKSYCRIKDSI